MLKRIRVEVRRDDRETARWGRVSWRQFQRGRAPEWNVQAASAPGLRFGPLAVVDTGEGLQFVDAVAGVDQAHGAAA